MITKYDQIYQKSIKNKEAFWSEVAEDIFWYKKPTKILKTIKTYHFTYCIILFTIYLDTLNNAKNYLHRT